MATGSWGTPEFGLTERLSNLFGQGRTSQGGSNLFGSQAQTTLAPSQQNSPASSGGSFNQLGYTPTTKGAVKGATTTAPAGSSGGGAATNTGGDNNNYDPNADANRQKEDAQRIKDAEVAREREAIAGEFDPIFQELDRQIGSLPGQKKELETQLVNLADTQKAGVAATEAKGLQELAASGETEKGNAKVSLRNLEEDVRNLLQAKQFFFGSMGAGDSSAVDMASEAVTKGALRSRGNVLAARDTGLAEIETKKQDVRDLAGEQGRKIEEWKSTKMFDLTEKFQTQTDQLNMAKANATGAKAKAINDVIRGLNQDYIKELRTLDDKVSTYKQSVATWQMERTAALEDYEKQLQISQKYTSSAAPKYSDALSSFQKIYGTGQMSIQDARTAVSNQYGIDPLSGLDLSSDQSSAKKRSLADELSDEALTAVFSQQ